MCEVWTHLFIDSTPNMNKFMCKQFSVYKMDIKFHMCFHTLNAKNNESLKSHQLTHIFRPSWTFHAIAYSNKCIAKTNQWFFVWRRLITNELCLKRLMQNWIQRATEWQRGRAAFIVFSFLFNRCNLIENSLIVQEKRINT